jgi:hypothetical protein
VARFAQQTVIRSQRTDIERLNRRAYAERRLRRSKLKSAQVDAVVAIATIGSSRAEHFDNDAPIITGPQLAKEWGVHESTARDAAESVCNLPGSPIKRVTKPIARGKRITTYELAVRDPIELLERMVVVAEALEKPAKTRPDRPRCPDHPSARVNVYRQHECSRCGKVLATEIEGPPAQYVENARIEGDPLPTVDGPVVSTVENARIDGPPAVIDFGVIARDRPSKPDKPWRCPECRAFERRQFPDDGWHCLGCGLVRAAVAGGSE